jgi:antimicrobial peptide system SdpB family protein
MHKNIAGRLANFLKGYDPWTNVYGAARSLLALTSAATLATNAATTLFRPASGTPTPPVCGGAQRFSAYCIAPPEDLPIAKAVCVLLLLVVASGWRPRVTGVVHWWICASYHVSAVMIEGGDQVAAVLTFLMLPITLTDGRRWHWSPPEHRAMSQAEAHRRLCAAFGHLLIRLQVAGIYFHAVLGKLTVPEWKDGTAMFYWVTHESFGAPRWLMPVLWPVVVNGPSVAALTWFVIVLEMALSTALFVERRYQIPLMWLGFALHIGITFVHSLPSFSLIMLAALMLYLHPLPAELPWLSRLWNAARWLPRRTYKPSPDLGGPVAARPGLRESESS